MGRKGWKCWGVKAKESKKRMVMLEEEGEGEGLPIKPPTDADSI